jgi:alpha-N-arabinofuranosidase
MVTMARSRGPWGPFEACPRNPVLSHRSHLSPIQALGHADLLQAESGEWFAVCLGVRPHGYPPCYHLGRETFLIPLSWAEDGFPVFGEQGKISSEMESPLSPAEAPAEASLDEFDSKALGMDWNHLRNPAPGSFSLQERPGWLRLRGQAGGLEGAGSPAWIGRRQRHFELRASALMEFKPEGEGEEAGLLVWMNERHHYEIFVALRGGRPSVVLRRRIGSLTAETACAALPADAASRLWLAVEAGKESYRFLYGPSEAVLQPLGEGETRYLSTEVAGGFTGVYLALYAAGGASPCLNPADFDCFSYSWL